jgi:hypothetical protein
MEPLICQECETVSDELACGWRAYRGDVPGEDDEPVLHFYCPSCAEREFGPRAGQLDGHVSLEDSAVVRNAPIEGRLWPHHCRSRM